MLVTVATDQVVTTLRISGRNLAIAAALVVGILSDAVLLASTLETAEGLHFGGDLEALLGATNRFVAGDGFYLPYQLAGPYDEDPMTNILYPPVALGLFVPFTILPSFLWWLVPVAVIAGTIWYWRPALWALVAVAICVFSYPTIIAIHQGNPVMWVAAFVALGTRWPAFGALAVIKPSLFPFALLGVRHRGWWMVTALLAAMSLLLLPMTLDWLHVMLNIRGGRTNLIYSLPEAVFVAIPLAAWLGRSRR